MRLLEAKYRKALAHLKAAYEAIQLPLDAVEEAGGEVPADLLRGEFHDLWREVKEFARCQHNVQMPHGGRS
jgi:hypothetical protein